MTAKEYLRKIYSIRQRIQRLEQKRELIRAELYGTRSPSDMNTDRVQSSMAGDAMLRLVAKVDEIERDIVKQKDILITKQEAIIRQIEAMEDERYKTVLYDRYARCHRWERIAVDMDIDIRHVFRIHREALQVFEKAFLEPEAPSETKSIE